MPFLVLECRLCDLVLSYKLDLHASLAFVLMIIFFFSLLICTGLWGFRCSKGCWELPHFSSWSEYFCCTTGKLFHIRKIFFHVIPRRKHSELSTNLVGKGWHECPFFVFT